MNIRPKRHFFSSFDAELVFFWRYIKSESHSGQVTLDVFDAD